MLQPHERIEQLRATVESQNSSAGAQGMIIPLRRGASQREEPGQTVGGGALRDAANVDIPLREAGQATAGGSKPSTTGLPMTEIGAVRLSATQSMVIPLRVENPVLTAIRAGQAERLRQAMEYRRTVGDPLEKLSTLLPMSAEDVSVTLDDVDDPSR